MVQNFDGPTCECACRHGLGAIQTLRFDLAHSSPTRFSLPCLFQVVLARLHLRTTNSNEHTESLTHSLMHSDPAACPGTNCKGDQHVKGGGESHRRIPHRAVLVGRGDIDGRVQGHWKEADIAQVPRDLDAPKECNFSLKSRECTDGLAAARNICLSDCKTWTSYSAASAPREHGGGGERERERRKTNNKRERER